MKGNLLAAEVRSGKREVRSTKLMKTNLRSGTDTSPKAAEKGLRLGNVDSVSRDFLTSIFSYVPTSMSLLSISLTYGVHSS
jgi:hypothetical protein